MPRNNFILMLLSWLIAIVALAFLSNKAGHLMARAGLFRNAGDAPRITKTDGNARTRPSASRAQAARPGQVETVMKKLMLLSNNSADLESDWDGHAAIDRLLERLTAGELSELYDRLDGSGDFVISMMSRKVGARWAAMDPEGAVKAALAKSKTYGRFYAVSILSDWAADHPQEALVWLDAEGGDDPALEKAKETCRFNLLLEMAERDFTLAKDEVTKMDEKISAGILHNWGYMHVTDPAMRGKLIEYVKSTGRPGDFAALNDGLVKAWPDNDPLGLMNHLQELQEYLESDAVPAAARSETDAAAVGVAIRREYHDAALEWWMGRYSQSRETPQPLREAMRYWTGHSPEVAVQWLAEQPESPQRDALSALAVPVFFGKGQFPKAAEIIERINDPALRQAGIERLDLLWGGADPTAASAWKKSRAGGH
ncbi:MAG: hypothetical protein EOP87_09340 [Verrucomicrobiaceae bacterium]|nr:MAG: hypothetical protein EOP87_09340 [Verrucomicrobiaceae bacterium]